MLNLLRSSQRELRKFQIEMRMALGMGVLLAACLIVLEETDAQQEMAQHSSHLPNFGEVPPPQVMTDIQIAKAQVELAHLKSRVNYLTRRQQERDDLNDVQAILLENHGRQKGLMADLHSLQWQHGKLEFEGISQDADKWHALMNDMTLFDRWKTAPQMLHAHRAMTKPSHSGASLVEVKLKASLWAHASNAPVLKAEP